jgi:hypothetical protein
MEVELQSIDTLKGELLQAQADAQTLMAMRQKLSGQVQQLTVELQRAHAEVQQVPALHVEIDGLRQELHRARNAFEYERAAQNYQGESSIPACAQVLAPTTYKPNTQAPPPYTNPIGKCQAPSP